MKHCHGYGWQRAKHVHTVLVCKMEETRINWNELNKLIKFKGLMRKELAQMKVKGLQIKTSKLSVGFTKEVLVAKGYQSLIIDSCHKLIWQTMAMTQK